MSKLYPTIDEFECPRYKCKDCVHFKFVNPKNPHGCTKRFDHAIMEVYAPYFVSEKEGYCPICSDFEPSQIHAQSRRYWYGFEHYKEWLRRQDEEDGLKSKSRPYVSFFIHKNPKIVYKVDLDKYVYGNMFDGNKLITFEKRYYKSHKKKNDLDFPLKLIREKCDFVEIDSLSIE